MRTLSFEEIKRITFGSVLTEQLEDGIHFHKCTAKQEAAWASKSDFLGGGALTTTGVRLDFVTDSKHLRFDTASGNRFELWINGVLMQQFLMNDYNKENKAAEWALGEGEKRVTLTFPSHDAGVLSYVALDDGASVRPTEFARKMLLIGDSITQGYNSDYDSMSYAWRTAMYFDADCVIQGIGGAYYAEDTFDDIPFDADVVTVAYGTNDYGHYKTLEEISAHAEAYLALVKERFAGKKIFVISPVWRADTDKPRSSGSFSEVIDAVESAAKKHGLTVISGMSLMPHLSTFMKDGYLHPNDMGFGVYAENLIKALSRAL